mmetsp:Transcript_27818/g.52168  ORF Transcript_27818/g.52168 Transcript_27818/m.52168 type:complete len:329 (+) Transcript_27818:697-1683(+)
MKRLFYYHAVRRLSLLFLLSFPPPTSLFVTNAFVFQSFSPTRSPLTREATKQDQGESGQRPPLLPSSSFVHVQDDESGDDFLLVTKGKHDKKTTATRRGPRKQKEQQTHGNRRQVLTNFVLGTSLLFGSNAAISQPARAIITDETDTYGDNWWSSNDGSKATSDVSTKVKQQSSAPPSDEITIQVPRTDLQSKEGLGLELGEVEFRTNRRVYIKSVTPGSVADKLGIKKDWIVVAINGNVRNFMMLVDIRRVWNGQKIILTKLFSSCFYFLVSMTTDRGTYQCRRGSNHGVQGGSFRRFKARLRRITISQPCDFSTATERFVLLFRQW